MTRWTTDFIAQQVIVFGVWAWFFVYLAWPTFWGMVEELER